MKRSEREREREKEGGKGEERKGKCWIQRARPFFRPLRTHQELPIDTTFPMRAALPPPPPNARQIFYGSKPDACYFKGTRSTDRKAPARPCGRQPPVGAAPARRPRGNAKSKCDSIWTSSNPDLSSWKFIFKEIKWTKLEWVGEDTK